MRVTDATSELLRCLLHSLRWFLMPIQLICLMSPERLRVFERVRLNLILDVRYHGDSSTTDPLAGPPLRRGSTGTAEGS